MTEVDEGAPFSRVLCEKWDPEEETHKLLAKRYVGMGPRKEMFRHLYQAHFSQKMREMEHPRLFFLRCESGFTAEVYS